MKKLLLLSIVLMLYYSTSYSQTPFTGCNPSFYQVIAGQLNLLDPTVEPSDYTDVQNNNLGSYNATGYNPVDNLIYGMLSNENLVVIGSDQILVNLGPITNVPTISGNYFVGDFDLNGNYYIIRGNNMFKIDVTTQVGQQVSLNGNGGGIADFAYYDPDGDASNGFSFVGVRSGGDQIKKIDLSPNGLAGNVQTINLTGIGNPNINNENSQGFGAAYTTNGGVELYFSNNFTGNFYQVNIDETINPPQAYAVYISTAQMTNNNDGASCANAESPFPCNINILLLETVCTSSSSYDLIASISTTNPVSTGFTADVNNGEVTQSYNYLDVPPPPNNQVIVNSLSVLGLDIPVVLADNIDIMECAGMDTYDSPDCCQSNAGIQTVDCTLFCPDPITGLSNAMASIDVSVSFGNNPPPPDYNYVFFLTDGTNILSIHPASNYLSATPIDFTETVPSNDLPPGEYEIVGYNYDPNDPDFPGLPVLGSPIADFGTDLDEIDGVPQFGPICSDLNLVKAVNFSVFTPGSITVFAGTDQTACSSRKLDLNALGASISGANNAVWTTNGDGMFLDDSQSIETNNFAEAAFYMFGPQDAGSSTLILSLSLIDCPNGDCMDLTDEVNINVLKVDCGSFPWDGNE